MTNSTHFTKYLLLYNRLSVVISDANAKLIAAIPDPFFEANANFHTKSFLVMMCAYLESYLKEILMEIVSQVNFNLKSIQVPYNLVRWGIDPEKSLNDKDMQFIDFKVSITKKKLDEHISGNPHRTKELFKRFGIQLDKDAIFVSQVEKIQSIVTKRNNVMHHDDDASDVSNSDLLAHIAVMIEYMENIDTIVMAAL